MKFIRVILSLIFIGLAVWGMVDDLRKKTFLSFLISSKATLNSERRFEIEKELQSAGFPLASTQPLKIDGDQKESDQLNLWVERYNEKLMSQFDIEQSKAEEKLQEHNRLQQDLDERLYLQEAQLDILKNFQNSPVDELSQWEPLVEKADEDEPSVNSEALVSAATALTSEDTVLTDALKAENASQAYDHLTHSTNVELNIQLIAEANIIVSDHVAIDSSVTDSDHLKHPSEHHLSGNSNHALEFLSSDNLGMGSNIVQSDNLSSSPNITESDNLIAESNALRPSLLTNTSNTIQSDHFNSGSNTLISDYLKAATNIATSDNLGDALSLSLSDNLSAQSNIVISDNSTHSVKGLSHALSSGTGNTFHMDHKPFLGKMTSEITSKLSTKISQVSTQLTSVFEDKLSNWKGELHQQLQELQASSVENQKHGLEWLSQSHASLNRASQQQNLWQQQWLLSTKHRLEAEHLHLKQQLRRLKSKRPQRPQRPELLNVTSSPRDISISELKQGYRFILFGFAICFAFNLIWEAIAQRPKL